MEIVRRVSFIGNRKLVTKDNKVQATNSKKSKPANNSKKTAPTAAIKKVSSLTYEYTFVNELRGGAKIKSELEPLIPKPYVSNFISKYVKLDLIYYYEGKYHWYSDKQARPPNYLEHAKEIAQFSHQLGVNKLKTSSENAAIERAITEHLKTGYKEIYDVYMQSIKEREKIIDEAKKRGVNNIELDAAAKTEAEKQNEDSFYKAFFEVGEKLSIKLSELRAIIKYDPSKLKGSCYICKD